MGHDKGLLNFQHDMLLLLSRDLHVQHKNMQVLIVEKKRGNWLVLPQSDFYFIQQLRVPVLFSDLIQQNAWLPEEYIKHVVEFIYTKGLLEVNGSAIWDPDLFKVVSHNEIGRLEFYFNKQNRQAGWRFFDSTLANLLNKRSIPLEVFLYNPSQEDVILLDNILNKNILKNAELPAMIYLVIHDSACSKSFISLAEKHNMKIVLEEVSKKDFLNAVTFLQNSKQPFVLRFPWDEQVAPLIVFNLLKQQVKEIDLILPWMQTGYIYKDGDGVRIAKELLLFIDNMMTGSYPSFVCPNITSFLARLIRFPWGNKVMECGGSADGVLVACSDGYYYPCHNFIGIKKYASKSINIDKKNKHEMNLPFKQWWHSFAESCPGIALRCLGEGHMDFRNRFFQHFLEGLMWRLNQHGNKLLEQFGIQQPNQKI